MEGYVISIFIYLEHYLFSFRLYRFRFLYRVISRAAGLYLNIKICTPGGNYMLNLYELLSEDK